MADANQFDAFLQDDGDWCGHSQIALAVFLHNLFMKRLAFF